MVYGSCPHQRRFGTYANTDLVYCSLKKAERMSKKKTGAKKVPVFFVIPVTIVFLCLQSLVRTNPDIIGDGQTA